MNSKASLLYHKKKKFTEKFSKDYIVTEFGKYAYWEGVIVPSCIYPTNGSYTCVFCSTIIKSTYGIRRHYNEKHFEKIPEGIFGIKAQYECKACEIQFKRKIELNRHLSCDLHLNLTQS